MGNGDLPAVLYEVTGLHGRAERAIERRGDSCRLSRWRRGIFEENELWERSDGCKGRGMRNVQKEG